MKVIAYCRVSTEKQDLNRQKMLAKEYCKVRGYELVDTIVEKQSGAKTDRGGLNKLLSLTSDECDLVCVSELSRISREEEFQRIFSKIDTLRDNGISVVFLDDPANIYTPDNPISFVQFIMLGVRAQGAREELLKIRDRMKSGREAKLRANPMMVTTSQVPFGYEKYDNPDYVKSVTPKSLLRVKESERRAVRFCFDMACSGKSCQKIADWLNANGLHHNNNKGKKQWHAVEVARMLRNRLYIGERTVEGVTHIIEPFVSLEVFEMAGRCISKNRCIITKEEHFNPLKGLFFCGHCGLPMSPHQNQYHKLVYKCLHNVYVGKNPNRELKPCNNNYCQFDQINDIVFENVISQLQSDAYYGQSQLTITDYERQLNAIDNETNGRRQELVETQTEIKTLLGQLRKIENEYLIRILQDRFSELKTKADKQEADVVRLFALRDEINDKMEQLKSDTFINKEMTPYERAEFFHKVLERIEWKGEKFRRHGILSIFYKNGCRLDIALNYKELPEGFGTSFYNVNDKGRDIIEEDGLDSD